ncbi:MAG TPA: phosphoribosylformylglycinamidine synthase [Rhodanobacteraceae bacterium]|nr:phosphoribosylformylglycinamidine synthase [Rhodanobacteraceae bacterium]
MIVFDGLPALSPFRLERLNSELERVHSGGRISAAWHVYFVTAVDSEQALDLARLRAVLRAAPGVARPARLWVVPRLGTISPWSSKATDILRGCGFAVQRVERGMAFAVDHPPVRDSDAGRQFARALHDPMTQSVLSSLDEAQALFAAGEPRPLARIALGAEPAGALRVANAQLGLALAPDEIEYLAERYAELGRDPSDAELMMFAQANSEHCRHKVFNASWKIDGQAQERSLFAMIRNTHALAPQLTLSAYSDNAAVIEGSQAARFFARPDGRFGKVEEQVDFAIKVETHNHPTAIAPFPGASTGAGGEIRDEGATGRGGKPKAGLTGFTTSYLRIPDLPRPWEEERPLPPRMASAFEIMRDGPIGAAAFNNEFGRPCLGGYFRTFEAETADPQVRRGYDKPIMIAGGLANLRRPHVEKRTLQPGDAVVVLGGPAMLIGLGGGAASSLASGDSSEELDFASVQRDNAEMERRCQEVIDRCWSLGDANPIVSIHDVGAGGLSNAIPEILHDSHVGGRIELRKIPSADPQLSPMQIWCNEAQERYVIGLRAADVAAFAAICERERCPFAVVGEVTEEQRLVVSDASAARDALPLTPTLSPNEETVRGEAVPSTGAPPALSPQPSALAPIDLPMDVLFGKAPKMLRDVKRKPQRLDIVPDLDGIGLEEAITRVLRLPAVGSKSFLITIGDRTVGGLCARDPMVGPWQVPVADCAVTLCDFDGYAGEAMAMGERTPVALLSAPASARLAVGEVITNLASAPIADLGEIKLSANWMAAAGYPGDDAALYDAVRAVAMELCPQLNISIPVGKDSLSMQAVWQQDGRKQKTVAPVSLIVSGFVRVADVRRALTPQLRLDVGKTELWLLDLGAGQNRLGGSVLAQVYNRASGLPADADNADLLKRFFAAIQAANSRGLLLAYHDRSDGGAIVTLIEMAFASRCGLDVELNGWGENTLSALFAEELGAVVQIRAEDRAAFTALLTEHGLADVAHFAGNPRNRKRVKLWLGGEAVARWPWEDLMAAWSETSNAMQSRRDNPESARAEHEWRCSDDDPGISPKLSFDPSKDVAAPYIARGLRPKVAILRDQGVNGQVEMAAAFTRAGFEAFDVHMTDLQTGRLTLDDFAGLAACGGFSYGDVLGAGRGWATSILYNPRLRLQFAEFFSNSTKFALGACNGCQMLAALKEIIPGADFWPSFERNTSEQYEARVATLEVLESPSIFLQGMAGSRIPVAVAHGEGRAQFAQSSDIKRAGACLRFVDNDGKATERYPLNPNGSPKGITGLTAAGGRVTALMPHPERVFRSVQMSWAPREWGADSPWMRMFRNARIWAG